MLAQTTLTSLLAETALDPDKSLVQQIYRVLWDAIVSLKIVPGQRVSEKEIAAALNASKTPVREALIRLEDVGLVQVVPQSGTYVTAIQLSAYIEGCFIRLQLETGAVRRAAQSGGGSNGTRELESIIAQQRVAWQDDDFIRFAALDEAFHIGLFACAELPSVWDVLQKTQADVNRVRHFKRIKGIRRGSAVIEQHQAIVDAIQAKDPDGAAAALVEHIGSLEQEIEKLTKNTELLEFLENQNTKHSRKSKGNNPLHAIEALKVI